MARSSSTTYAAIAHSLVPSRRSHSLQFVPHPKDPSRCFLFTKHKRDATTAQSLSGILYHGKKLDIKCTQVPAKGGASGAGGGSDAPSSGPRVSADVIQALEAALPSLYHQQSHFLNLSALSASIKVRARVRVRVRVCRGAHAFSLHGQQTAKCDLNNDSFVTTLWQVLQRIAPDVVSINLANNGIKRLRGFATMAQLLPNVRNLNFNLNHISDFKELDHLTSARLEQVCAACCCWLCCCCRATHAASDAAFSSCSMAIRSPTAPESRAPTISRSDGASRHWCSSIASTSRL